MLTYITQERIKSQNFRLTMGLEMHKRLTISSELFFNATKRDFDADKLQIILMYLKGNVKLWWRSKVEDGDKLSLGMPSSEF